ncbi:hypothetical protein AB0J01_37805 [Streptomyces sp. NPDC050204]|uniref:hypothetical protein n=1 Tax=Streptomyces sp. NPDC050204 TaxID=3155514 RepID=UPI00342A9A50
MNSTLRRALISARFARLDTDDNFGPASALGTKERAWRKENLDAAFKGYRDKRVMGVGADWCEALRDAADTGRIDLAEYDGDLKVAREALLHGALWEFVTTADGVAILDIGATYAA